jgi:hypothetical protein
MRQASDIKSGDMFIGVPERLADCGAARRIAS